MSLFRPWRDFQTSRRIIFMAVKIPMSRADEEVLVLLPPRFGMFYLQRFGCLWKVREDDKAMRPLPDLRFRSLRLAKKVIRAVYRGDITD